MGGGRKYNEPLAQNCSAIIASEHAASRVMSLAWPVPQPATAGGLRARPITVGMSRTPRLTRRRPLARAKETPPCHSLAADGAPGLLTGGWGAWGGVRRDRESNVGCGPSFPLLAWLFDAEPRAAVAWRAGLWDAPPPASGESMPPPNCGSAHPIGAGKRVLRIRAQKTLTFAAN